MNWNALAGPKYRQEGLMIREEREIQSVNIHVEFSYSEF
jgi:hypothetical protein